MEEREQGFIQTQFFFGGRISTPASTANTETWDGTSWTEVNNLNTAREHLAGNGDTSTSVLAYGGGPSGVANTESWNGTSWTEQNDLGTARTILAGAGTSASSALAFGGYPKKSETEEWTAADFEIKSVTQS